MIVYGITLDYEVVRVRLGSPEMGECREIAMTEENAKRRALEMQGAKLSPWLATRPTP